MLQHSSLNGTGAQAQVCSGMHQVMPCSLFAASHSSASLWDDRQQTLRRNHPSAVAVVFRHAARTHSVQCTFSQGNDFAAPPSSLLKRQQWYFGQRSSLAPGRQLAVPASSQPMQNINGQQTCPQASCGFGCSITFTAQVALAHLIVSISASQSLQCPQAACRLAELDGVI